MNPRLGRNQTIDLYPTIKTLRSQSTQPYLQGEEHFSEVLEFCRINWYTAFVPQYYNSTSLVDNFSLSQEDLGRCTPWAYRFLGDEYPWLETSSVEQSLGENKSLLPDEEAWENDVVLRMAPKRTFEIVLNVISVEKAIPKLVWPEE